MDADILYINARAGKRIYYLREFQRSGVLQSDLGHVHLALVYYNNMKSNICFNTNHSLIAFQCHHCLPLLPLQLHPLLSLPPITAIATIVSHSFAIATIASHSHHCYHCLPLKPLPPILLTLLQLPPIPTIATITSHSHHCYNCLPLKPVLPLPPIKAITTIASH